MNFADDLLCTSVSRGARSVYGWSSIIHPFFGWLHRNHWMKIKQPENMSVRNEDGEKNALNFTPFSLLVGFCEFKLVNLVTNLKFRDLYYMEFLFGCIYARTRIAIKHTHKFWVHCAYVVRMPHFLRCQQQPLSPLPQNIAFDCNYDHKYPNRVRSQTTFRMK